jgi:hypothetical protein
METPEYKFVRALLLVILLLLFIVRFFYFLLRVINDPLVLEHGQRRQGPGLL